MFQVWFICRSCTVVLSKNSTSLSLPSLFSTPTPSSMLHATLCILIMSCIMPVSGSVNFNVCVYVTCFHQLLALFLGRLLWVDLIKWVSNVRPSTKSFFDFNEIRYVCRGRWVMHDSMQYAPIQGQSQGHEPSKVENSDIFKGYLLPTSQFIMGAGKWPRILKLGHNT